MTTPIIERMNRTPLPRHLTLVAGNSFHFKVLGLGVDRKHVVFKASTTSVKIAVISANPHNREQTLRLDTQSVVRAREHATLSAYLATRPTHKATADIELTIEPRLELSLAGTESNILASMLIVENITPGQRNFSSVDQALTSMQWMRWVLLNRLRLGPAHFGAPKSSTTLTDLIKAPNQVKGFARYPSIEPGQKIVLDDVLKIANDSSDKNFETYRKYVQNAIDVAKGHKLGSDPCPTGLYAWRTSGRASPGPNFVLYESRGGQDFYTLTNSFLKDPLQRARD
ncbi:hypothetical protein LJ656_13135 [Paraburkholderia sp. MMS20-SJTR3]|uniref:Uncharacterized protein n=1 Tax=Paraburkholderia sejongensis TaxID=2886946 RepID=A0ABS8JUH4_9BURK|nr:hypothetical protein [Paraburkholderia sp. MMS20-SJTR3]MCC8393537.1 hypothetical protein [Paraburkholderia sp. MMS20-SJTR3]